MGLDILRLGIGSVVHISTNVAVVVLVRQFLPRHQPTVFRNHALVRIDIGYLLDILGTKHVLILALVVFTVGVDKEYAFAIFRTLPVDDKDRRRDSRAVEKLRRQSDHTLKNAAELSVDQLLAITLLFATTEKDTVRHDDRHPSLGLQRRDHVLYEHEVRLLLPRHPEAETLLELHVRRRVVLGERWIRHHNVELAESAALRELRREESVALLDPCIPDAMEDHVHLAHLVGVVDELLSVERQVTRTPIAGLHVVTHVDEESARAHGRVADLRVLRGLEDLAHQFDHGGRRVELAALFACDIGEILKQVFVGRSQQVGKLEIVVRQRNLVEVVDELHENPVRQLLLALRVDLVEFR